MTIGKIVLGALAAASFCVGHVSAQTTQNGYAVQPVSAYSYYQDAESPSDVAVVADAGCGCEAPTCDTCDPCGSYCSSEPWTLIDSGCSGLEIGGWIEAGIYANQYGEANQGPLGFQATNGDGAVLNQAWMFIDKATDTGGCGVDFGGHVDFLFGADGPDTQAFGNPTTWDNSWEDKTSRDYGWAMPQLYAEIAINDWTIKGGHFYTTIGWEVVQAPDNFFYSHAYTMYYGEPFTHTGVLASYGGFDKLDVTMGWTAGWDTGYSNTNNASTVLGLVSYELNDCMDIIYSFNAGHMGTGAGNIYMQSLCLDVALTDNLEYIIQSDIGNIDNIDNGAGVGVSQKWGGVNQYLLYTINDCWAAGTRLEWFNDVNDRTTSGAGDYWEMTYGLNYSPCANIKLRPELRYDWYTGQGTPFNNGGSKQQFAGGCDLIVTW